LLHLSGTAEIIVRSLLMGVAMSGYGLLYWLRSRREQRKAAEAQRGQAEGAGGEQEIDVLVRDAETRLAASLLGKEAKLAHLPAFFLVGETGSAKTSTFVHSGVEPDLLAGHVYQDNSIIPTRPVNIWLAQKSVFIEGGGKLLTEPARWAHLIKRLQPPKFRN
jgi:type VI secretion system protein ImpL